MVLGTLLLAFALGGGSIDNHDPIDPAHSHPPRNPVARIIDAVDPRVALHLSSILRLDDRRVVNDEGDPIDDRFNLREIEFEFRGSVGGLAEGVVILSSEAETPGEYETGVEEAYLNVRRFFDIPPGPIEIKAGRFRPEIGRLNELHTHLLPQTVRPRSFVNFLGEEGFSQDGAQVAVELGARNSGQRLRASSSLVNGGGLPVGEGNDGENFAYTVHAELAFALGQGHSFEVGASTWQGRNDAAGDRTTGLYAVDATYEWRPHGADRPATLTLAGEGYYAQIDEPIPRNSTPVGGFLWGEIAMGERTSVGGLVDFVESLLDERLETTTAALFANYRFAQDLRVRVGVDRVIHSDIRELNHLDTVFFELNFALGTHRHD